MKFIKYVVRKGDNLTKIAKAHGFAGKDWKKIYDHPKNAAFRKQRPDPDRIEPKDVIFIPEIPGAEIDDEIARLESMLAQLMGMPPAIKKSINEAKRMGLEAQRVVKSGAMIQADIAGLRSMQAVHRAELTTIDALAKAYGKDENKGKGGIAENAKSFAEFQKRQDALSKLINTLKSIDDAEKHLIRDPKKVMFAMGTLGKDMAKIQKLTAEWEKAHADAVKEIEARLKTLRDERKETV